MTESIAPVDIRFADGVAMIRFEASQIDHDNVDLAMALIFDYVDQFKPSRVVVNLRRVGYLHSIGIGMLSGLLKRVQSYGGRLKLCSLQPEVDELLTLTHMHAVFDCYDTEPSALASFPDVS